MNRYNAPEMLSALLQALEVAGLSEVVARIKQMGVPRMINDAWTARPKTALEIRVAAKWLKRRA